MNTTSKSSQSKTPTQRKKYAASDMKDNNVNSLLHQAQEVIQGVTSAYSEDLRLDQEKERTQQEWIKANASVTEKREETEQVRLHMEVEREKNRNKLDVNMRILDRAEKNDEAWQKSIAIFLEELRMV